MAEADKPSFFDQALGYIDRLGNTYQKVELANHGVSTTPTATYETQGANAPVVQQGASAGVSVRDPLAEAINGVSTKAAAAYGAKQLSDSMPYIVGMMALGITIYLLTRK